MQSRRPCGSPLRSLVAVVVLIFASCFTSRCFAFVQASFKLLSLPWLYGLVCSYSNCVVEEEGVPFAAWEQALLRQLLIHRAYRLPSTGSQIGPVGEAQIKFSDSEWKAKLAANQYLVLRQKATEPGVYLCAGCLAAGIKQPLYTSEMKFDCGCGWPGFWTNVHQNVIEMKDADGRRCEILCSHCHGHLGHVFRGEGFGFSTDERHCVNSLSLAFMKKDTEEIILPSYQGPVFGLSESTRSSFGFAEGCRRACRGRGHNQPRALSAVPHSRCPDSADVQVRTSHLCLAGWGGDIGRSADSADWAELVEPAAVRAGDILLGDPARFFSEQTSPAFRRIGLQGGIPADYPRRERLRYLPVLLLTEVDKDAGTAQGVWLTLRDFINFFHSRPLLYGVTMVHPYPEVPGSKLLSEGIYAWVEEGEGSSLRIRFFLNHIQWRQGELAAELAPGENTWLPVRCSVDVVLSETDEIDAKPLWVKVAELAGGRLEQLGRAHDLM
eukprot:symbB.v1.2.024751.t2/scaffold2367.1/size81165/4